MDDFLWEAFLAGFNSSGEGWNGEYPPGVSGVCDTDLRAKFDAWVAEMIATGVRITCAR